MDYIPILILEYLIGTKKVKTTMTKGVKKKKLINHQQTTSLLLDIRTEIFDSGILKVAVLLQLYPLTNLK